MGRELGRACLYLFVGWYWIEGGDDGWEAEHRLNYGSWIDDGDDSGVTILVTIFHSCYSYLFVLSTVLLVTF